MLFAPWNAAATCGDVGRCELRAEPVDERDHVVARGGEVCEGLLLLLPGKLLVAEGGVAPLADVLGGGDDGVLGVGLCLQLGVDGRDPLDRGLPVLGDRLAEGEAVLQLIEGVGAEHRGEGVGAGLRARRRQERLHGGVIELLLSRGERRSASARS